jgi:hypothetical protein
VLKLIKFANLAAAHEREECAKWADLVAREIDNTNNTATYIARYDDLFNGKEEKLDVSQVAVSMNGIELQDREFFAAIREGREPNASVAQVLPCYQVLHDLEQQLV